MARYNFDIKDGAELIEDREGSELAKAGELINSGAIVRRGIAAMGSSRIICRPVNRSR